jgi:hypothetical protein
MISSAGTDGLRTPHAEKATISEMAKANSGPLSLYETEDGRAGIPLFL